MADPDEDEVMIGEIPVNEEVEHRKSEVSGTEFDDWQQKEYEGRLKELQSQNDFRSTHGKQRGHQNTLGTGTTKVKASKQDFVMIHFNT